MIKQYMFLVIAIVILMAAAMASAHGNNKVSVPAKVTVQKCGSGFSKGQYNWQYYCKQLELQSKRKKADNYKIKDVRIFRR